MWRSILAIVAAAALASPASASAASGWVPGFDEVTPSSASSSVWTPAAVVTPDLRTVAFWVEYPEIKAAVRPRGGTFGEPFEFDPGSSSYVSYWLDAIALPDGEVLAAWSSPGLEELKVKSLQPDGTITDLTPPEPNGGGGGFPAIAANDAGMVAVAYFSYNQVYVAVRPAGADAFEPPVLLLTLVGNEQPQSTGNQAWAPLDVTVRDDGQVAVAIGTSILNPPGGAARMLIARYAGGAPSLETVDSRTLTLTPAPGTTSGAEFRGAIELLPDGRQLLAYRLSSVTSGFATRELRGGPRDGSSAPPPPQIAQSEGNAPGPREHGLTLDDTGRPWLWWRHGIASPADDELRVRQFTTAGAFSTPTQVLASPSFGTVDIAAFGVGRTGVLFTEDGKVKASTSEDGAGFGAPVEVATPSSVTPSPAGSVELAGGGEGSAVALWQDGATGQTAALHATPFDATPPELLTLEAPGSLTAGVAGTFTATAADDWSVPALSWLFGDGATLTGSTVQRAFQSAGSFTATATATDAAGNSATDTRTVTVNDAPVEPSNASNSFKLGKPKLNKKRGTAKLPVTFPGPGTLVLTGKGVVRQTKTPKAAGTVKILVKAKGEKKRNLNANGKVKLKVKVTYTPTGGTANSKNKGLALKKLLG